MKMTESEYQEHVDDYAGYCTACDAVTRDDTEPDAERYKCPECEGMTCCGIELALLTGKIDLVDGDPDEGSESDESF